MFAWLCRTILLQIKTLHMSVYKMYFTFFLETAFQIAQTQYIVTSCEVVVMFGTPMLLIHQCYTLQ